MVTVYSGDDIRPPVVTKSVTTPIVVMSVNTCEIVVTTEGWELDDTGETDCSNISDVTGEKALTVVTAAEEIFTLAVL